MQVAVEITAASADYRRRARRIRASFIGNSFLTQQALGNLAKRRNAESGQARHAGTFQCRSDLEAFRRFPPQLDIATVHERGFAEHAESKLQAFGFTFSDRVALLDAAERLGISRFRANLLLAMHENQAHGRRPSNAGPAVQFAPSIVLILGMEILVVAALVWLCML